MFQSSSKVPPGIRELSNYTARDKLARQIALKNLKLFIYAYYLMSLFQYRTVVNHLVIVELLHNIHLTPSIGGPEFRFERLPQVLGNMHM